jgi:hypothetical protein
MSQRSIDNLIEYFNNGEYDDGIKPFFGNIVNFLRYANKHEFIDELSMDNLPLDEFEESLKYLDTLDKLDSLYYEEVPEEFKNTLLLYKLEKDPKNVLKWISDNLITDVYFMNGGYYLYIKNRQELADLFRQYRDYGPYEYAKSVLGEDTWEPFWDTTDNVYRDVIEELDSKNKNYLKNYILRELKDVKIELDGQSSEEMSLIASEQGNDDFFIVNQENVDRIINDEETMNWILINELPDLKSDLFNIHMNAYNSAYETEIYNYVWRELSTYFEPKSWETVKKEKNDGKTYYEEYLKVNDFGQIIYDFLSSNRNYTYNDSYLEYWGTLIGVISSLMNDEEYEWLNFRVSDYADWTLTRKYINEIFPDYL